MRSKRRITIIVIITILICILCLYQISQPHRIAGVPYDASVLFYKYMEAFRRGTAYSVDYIYFVDDFKRNAYINSGDKLVDYRIENVERINDQLYAFTLLTKTELSIYYQGDSFERVYNFVACINNKWYYLNGVSNIPPDLRENLTVSDYSYNDDNIVDVNDIVDVIDFE